MEVEILCSSLDNGSRNSVSQDFFVMGKEKCHQLKPLTELVTSFRFVIFIAKDSLCIRFLKQD